MVLVMRNVKQKKDKTLISKDDLDSCKEVIEILKADEKVQQLFQLNNTSSDTLEIHNELLLSSDLNDLLPDYDFGRRLTSERRGSSSVGRVSASQAECRGFE